ncbi:MAG TPA: hypothetical protein VNV85_10765 [Puia sp.]|jgi:hypothetical protein|nr:hypothetical protein [Puia sp.]
MNNREIYGKLEIGSLLIGEWQSGLEEIIYVFSDSPSCLKNGSLDLLVSNAKSAIYFLTTYSIIGENENTFIEIGRDKLFVKYFVNGFANTEIHLENSNHELLILKKL